MQSSDQAQESIVQKPTKQRSINFREYKFPEENFVESLSADGSVKLHNYRWSGKGTSAEHPPKLVISMFHGYGSYVGKFAYVARFFVEQGYDVIGMDMKGFGYSGGVRGLIEDRDDFYKEGFDFIMKAKNFYKDLYPSARVPFFTLGYSQGGALSLGISRLMSENNDSIDGSIHVVPNFKAQQAHWDDDFRQQLATLSVDPKNTLAFPFKPMKDLSFLQDYIMDELQFKGPHFARTISIVKQVSDKDYDHMKNIKYPVHVSLGNDDQVLCIEDMRSFYEIIQTPAELKEKIEYNSDHYILSDGWLYEEAVSNILAWLEKVVPTLHN